MNHLRPRIYLASQSPRRRELLRQIGVHFEVLLLRCNPSRSVDVDETPLPGESPADYVRRVSESKAECGVQTLGLRRLLPLPILAADTTVTLDGAILGKPENKAEAAAMLTRLSGRTHQVITSVSVAHGNRMETRTSTSEVTFAPLTEARIHRYLLSGESLDKAGGYGIQGQAAAFIQHLSGSYSGVMGLPLCETAELLDNFGFAIP
jgi:septum formation protein